MPKTLCDFPPVDIAAWRDAVQAKAPGTAQRLRSSLADGIDVEPLYPSEPEVVDDARAAAMLARGSRTAIIGQEYGAQRAAAVSEAIKEDRRFDLGAAWVRLDPGQRCGCEAPVGPRPGTVLRADDVAELVQAAGTASLWIDAGAGAARLRQAWNAAWPSEQPRGGLLSDPLGALSESGVLGVAPEAAIEALLEDLGRRPEGSPERSVLLSGLPYHDAGASAGQELGAVMATLIDLARRAEAAGVDVDRLLSACVIRLSVGSDLFVELAELRAARWLWCAVASQLSDEPPLPWLSARTAWRNRTTRDPWVNLLRATVETFAGIVGGADEVVTQPFTEVLGTPEANARRWALGTGHLLTQESHLARVLDPGGGSPHVEQLTEAIADRAWAFVRQIEGAGGMLEALRQGVVQMEVARTTQRRRQEVATGNEALTGVSIFPWLDEPKVEVEAPPPDIGAFGSGAPAIEIAPIAPVRLGEAFEALRDRSDAHRAKHGARPLALLVTVGPPAEHRARLSLARSLVPVGGFDVETIDAEEAQAVMSRLRSSFAVVCGGDERLAEALPGLVEDLRNAGARRVWVVAPPETLGEHATHVDGSIHTGADLPKLLTELHDALGVGR